MVYFCEQCGQRIEKPGKCKEHGGAEAALPIIEDPEPAPDAPKKSK